MNGRKGIMVLGWLAWSLPYPSRLSLSLTSPEKPSLMSTTIVGGGSGVLLPGS